MRRDIVVIGGSAGALDPLREIVAALPADLAAAVVVCFHLAATGSSALAAILNRSGALPAVRPRDGDAVKPGWIYVPTPDHHLEVTQQGFKVTKGPRVNSARPAVDVLFRSAANEFGPRTVGVILSGGLADGSDGMLAIKAAGGVTIVQSPEEALVDSMPRSTLALGRPDHLVGAARIGPLIAGIVVRTTEPGADVVPDVA